jgi:hypothetical protein
VQNGSVVQSQSALLFVAQLANFGHEPQGKVIRNWVLIVLCLVTLLFGRRAKDFIRRRLDARKSQPPADTEGAP